MDLEREYLDMITDTSRLVAQEKAAQLASVTSAFHNSGQLANKVEFWKWMGANYPNNFGNSQLIQDTALNKGRWLATQLQGKGYEWDYMSMQRMNPLNIMSTFEAGDSPTQPGIDIIEKDLFSGVEKATYQNKAYLSSNNPDLHNTPKDAIVVTNKEKVEYVLDQGYEVESYMDSDQIEAVHDARTEEAINGKVQTNYTLRNVSNAAVKAGVLSAVIGITAETFTSYKSWKAGHLTDEQYLNEILKAGGDAGVTGAATGAAMVPVQALITSCGASSLIGIPVAMVFGKAINSVIAPCFGRGKYRQILQEAKYYHGETYYSFDELKEAIEKYIKYYNEKRIKGKLGWLSPVQYRLNALAA